MRILDEIVKGSTKEKSEDILSVIYTIRKTIHAINYTTPKFTVIQLGGTNF